jgi:hypothetical protein
VPIAVPIVSPPANTRPFPLAVMCPSTVTRAWKSAIAHGVLGGWTPRTMLRVCPALGRRGRDTDGQQQ